MANKNPVWMLGRVSGYFAYSKMDDDGVAYAKITGGPHAGHTLTITTKSYRGGFGKMVKCSCGVGFNSFHENGYLKFEEGDDLIGDLSGVAYTSVYKSNWELTKKKMQKQLGKNNLMLDEG